MKPSIFNGELAEAVPAHSRGLAYGDGLFETIRFPDFQAPFWKLHMGRLRTGAGRLGLEMPEPAVLLEESQRLLDEQGPGIIKILVWRQSQGRGYAGATRACDRLLQWFNPPPPSDGVTLRLLEFQLAHQPRLAGLKHLNRLEQVLAAAELKLIKEQTDSSVDGIVTDQDGHLIEAVSSNLFLVRDNRILTPDLQHCGVAGVLRQALLEGYPTAWEHEASIARISVDELEAADEVFLGNSVRGITPVTEFRQRRWTVGPVTRALSRQFNTLTQTDGETL